MSLESVSKGFLVCSTPVHSSEEDSGYFGSNQKRSITTLTTCSPLKELCFNLSDSFHSEKDFDTFSQQPKYDKVLDYGEFRNDVYESSCFKIDKFSELEILNESVVKEDHCHSSLKEEVHDVPSFSKNSKSEIFALNSSIEKDSKTKLFDNELSRLKNENLDTFNKLNNASTLSHAHIKYTLPSTVVIKKNKIDFLRCFNEMNCSILISNILSCLSVKELCIASCVNKEWKQIVQSDCYANKRRKKFIKERNFLFNGPIKENRLGVRTSPARQMKKAFFDLTNGNTDKQQLVTRYSNTRFASFLKESENGCLKLKKCPTCCYASKSLNGSNYYKCTNCSYTFCSSCLNPVFKNHFCKKSELPNTIIGSKKSKKNLKRL